MYVFNGLKYYAGNHAVFGELAHYGSEPFKFIYISSSSPVLPYHIEYVFISILQTFSNHTSTLMCHNWLITSHVINLVAINSNVTNKGHSIKRLSF